MYIGIVNNLPINAEEDMDDSIEIIRNSEPPTVHLGLNIEIAEVVMQQAVDMETRVGENEGPKRREASNAG